MLLISCESEGEGIKPERINLIESVYSSIIIEPDSFYKVFAATGGIIDEIMVEEGEQIKKGDPVARVVDDNSILASQNAELEMNLAKQNYEGKSNLIKDLQNELAVATLKLTNDSTNFERQKRLWDQKIGSETEFEQRKLAYQTAQNNVSALRRQLKRKQDELQIAFQKSQNNYANSLNKQADFMVTSRVSGKVFELLKEEGESLGQQEPIAYIGSSGRFIIKMQVDEVDIVQVKKDQTVYVTLDAYENKVFEARVEKIIPQMNQETQTFWVEASFIDPPSVLYSGLRGEANIVIEKKENALTIPLAYLIDFNKVITKAETLTVVTGLRSLERVEILEGLDSNTTLIKP
tara:strand:+ start:5643 stop:6689 length:1047 start_codon:yes stop_codon:yes gene_type:complete